MLIATLCTVQFIDVLGTTIVIVALPAMQADLSLTAGTREQVVSIYALLFGALLLLAGRLADAWGARRLFIAGLITYGTGSLLGGLAQDGFTLVTGRGVQGVGAALAVPAALAMIADIFPVGDARNRVLGYWAATGAAGGAAGFALGGTITDLVGWHWTLLLTVPPIGLATLIMLAMRVPPSTPTRVTIPLVSALALTGGLLALTFGLTNGQTGDFAIPTMLLPIVVGLFLLGGFARKERGETPLIPPRAWGDRALRTGSAVGLVLTFTTSASAVLLTLYLQQLDGKSALATGWIFAPFSLAVIGGASYGARLVSRHGAPMAMRWGLVGVAAALGLEVAALAWASLALVVAGLALAGATLGIASVASTSHGLRWTDPETHGAASGLLSAAARIGTALGIAAFGLIAAVTTAIVSGAADRTAVIAGYQAAHLCGMVLALLMAARIPRKPPACSGRRSCPVGDGAARGHARRARGWRSDQQASGKSGARSMPTTPGCVASSASCTLPVSVTPGDPAHHVGGRCDTREGTRSPDSILTNLRGDRQRQRLTGRRAGDS